MTNKKIVDNVAYYHSYTYDSLHHLQRVGKMHGARRVITFCLLTAVLPTVLLIIPLYLRHSVYADVTYAVAESDVLEIDDGISTVFCEAHSLKMNTSFHSFQLKGSPERSTVRKHIRLKKSMVLPDDTLEYWGFYLPKGSTVILSVCSRFPGSRMLVVKGEKNLRTCGLLDHSPKPASAHMASGQGQVQVIFETQAQEILEDSQVHHRRHEAHGSVISVNKTEQETNATHQTALSHVDRSETLEKNKQEEEEVDENVATEDETYDQEKETDQKDPENLEGPLNIYLEKHKVPKNGNNTKKNHADELSENKRSRKVRHARKRLKSAQEHQTHLKEEPTRKKSETKEQRIKKLITSLTVEDRRQNLRLTKTTKKTRTRRDIQMNPSHILDAGVGHGGNAGNFTEMPDPESSVSSFENSLLTCYDGHILLVQGFPPSNLCIDVHALENISSMHSVHEVVADGYYYYIFYSDNDFVQNDIHAIFDIHKPTYQYTNFSKGCVNKTECRFPVSFWSDEVVIVEVPTRDGIEHEEDDITFLISSCHPRMSIYVIFPIAVLFLILGCAFL